MKWYINFFPLDWQLECVKIAPYVLTYITDKTQEMCNKAFENNIYTVKFIPENMKTPEMHEIEKNIKKEDEYESRVLRISYQINMVSRFLPYF